MNSWPLLLIPFAVGLAIGYFRGRADERKRWRFQGSRRVEL